MKLYFLPVLLAIFTSLGCVAEVSKHEAHTDVGRYQQLRSGVRHAEFQTEPFAQVGVLVDTTSEHIEVRVDGGDWTPVEVTWAEGVHKVGRLVLDAPATQLEIRTDTPWTFGTVQFFDHVEAGETLARELPVVEAESNIAALAPSSLVVTRAQWGARNPNRVCGSWHDPNRVSIHHTTIPADDGGDPAARLRQMQAYHIDTRGWCDIGYHFVVSQSGKIYQGRDEVRTGAHVDGRNTGNVGIAFIGNFERQQMNATQFAAGARILRWVGNTYGIALSRTTVKGHRERPGQSTDCPGTNLLRRLEELIRLAQGDISAPPSEPSQPSEPSLPADPRPETDGEAVWFFVNWRSEESDLYDGGHSAGIVDVMPGDWMRGEILIRNDTTFPLRNMRVSFDTEHLVPKTYTIESDAPHFDGYSFRRNDADSSPNNPPRSGMGTTGTFDLYSFAPGETKRVSIDFNAGEYSLGAVKHGRLRAWVRHIDDIYHTQNAFDGDPSRNIFVGLLQASNDVDILGPREWQFDGGDTNAAEGWSGCTGASVEVAPARGALIGTTTSFGQCILSPRWTQIDADDWDQLVMHANVSGSQTAALYWAREGERFDASRAVTFETSAAQSTYVFDLSRTAGWSGNVKRLLLVPSLEEATTIAVDRIYAQSTDGRVGSARERHVSGPLAPLSTNAPAPPVVDSRADNLGAPTAPVSDEPVAGGCSTTGGSAPLAPLLFALVFGVTRRTRD